MLGADEVSPRFEQRATGTTPDRALRRAGIRFPFAAAYLRGTSAWRRAGRLRGRDSRQRLRRLAGENFAQFNREVFSLLRRREVVVVLLLFLSPCSTFVLPYLLGGLGADFHASARAEGTPTRPPPWLARIQATLASAIVRPLP